MAISPGKRKRQDDEGDRANSSEDEDAMRALFQRAFEAKFRPLERTVSEREPESELEDEHEIIESDWSGLPSDDEQIETIQHKTASTENNDLQRHQRKAFMVCNQRSPAMRDMISDKKV